MGEDPAREPIAFASPPERHRKKWARIIAAFMTGDLVGLRAIQRSGSRGRILAALVRQCFDVLGISHLPEPVFEHVAPAEWYVDFAEAQGLKLVLDDRYNPDYLLADGTWVEVTLSENTAFKKLFRYGHQASRLLVLWLDPDTGLHKRVCAGLDLPNAAVKPVDSDYGRLRETDRGADIVRKIEALKELRHKIL